MLVRRLLPAFRAPSPAPCATARVVTRARRSSIARAIPQRRYQLGVQPDPRRQEVAIEGGDGDAPDQRARAGGGRARISGAAPTQRSTSSRPGVARRGGIGERPAQRLQRQAPSFVYARLGQQPEISQRAIETAKIPMLGGGEPPHAATPPAHAIQG